ncbi:unnamed protein product, partial [marine sediment metagenome]
ASGVAAYFLMTKGAAIATGLLTSAQWLLNAAMNANPIGLIVAAVAVLVPALIWLGNNWDFVKFKMVDFAKAAQIKMLELDLVIRKKLTAGVVAFAKVV